MGDKESKALEALGKEFYRRNMAVLDLIRELDRATAKLAE